MSILETLEELVDELRELAHRPSKVSTRTRFTLPHSTVAASLRILMP